VAESVARLTLRLTKTGFSLLRLSRSWWSLRARVGVVRRTVGTARSGSMPDWVRSSVQHDPPAHEFSSYGVVGVRRTHCKHTSSIVRSRCRCSFVADLHSHRELPRRWVNFQLVPSMALTVSPSSSLWDTNWAPKAHPTWLTTFRHRTKKFGHNMTYDSAGAFLASCSWVWYPQPYEVGHVLLNKASGRMLAAFRRNNPQTVRTSNHRHMQKRLGYRPFVRARSAEDFVRP
jgi:hypothetical protein